MSDNEIETRVQKQTKNERITNILLLFCAVFSSGYLIFSYIQPDPESLEFARAGGVHITVFLGFVIGMLFMNVISGRKGVKKQKNRGLFFLLLFLPCCIIIIIFLMLVFSFAALSMSDPDPNDYLLPLLSISGVMFVFGALISFARVYVDDIAEKLKRHKSYNNNVQKLTTIERINYIAFLFCVMLSSSLLIFSYTLPDPIYLNFTRSTGWPITGFFGLIIGVLLMTVLSGRKWVKKPKNSRLFILSFIIPGVAFFIIALALTSSFVNLNLSLQNPNEYLPAFLSFSGVMFVFGLLISFAGIYIDGIAEKFKKIKAQG